MMIYPYLQKSKSQSAWPLTQLLPHALIVIRSSNILRASDIDWEIQEPYLPGRRFYCLANQMDEIRRSQFPQRRKRVCPCFNDGVKSILDDPEMRKSATETETMKSLTSREVRHRHPRVIHEDLNANWPSRAWSPGDETGSGNGRHDAEFHLLGDQRLNHDSRYWS